MYRLCLMLEIFSFCAQSTLNCFFLFLLVCFFVVRVALPFSHNSMSFSRERKCSLHFPNLNQQSTDTENVASYAFVCGAMAKENHNALLRFNGKAIKHLYQTQRERSITSMKLCKLYKSPYHFENLCNVRWCTDQAKNLLGTVKNWIEIIAVKNEDRRAERDREREGKKSIPTRNI